MVNNIVPIFITISLFLSEIDKISEPLYYFDLHLTKLFINYKNKY